MTTSNNLKHGLIYLQIRKQEYQQEQLDHTIFFWHTENEKKSNSIVYDDDIIRTRDKEKIET